MSSPVFQRLGRVDQDGIGELSGELSNVFDGGAHVVFLVSFVMLWESCTSSWVSSKNYENNKKGFLERQEIAFRISQGRWCV